MKPEQPRLYSQLASWFHLLTSPANYAEEAEFALGFFTGIIQFPVNVFLLLGSCGCNIAFHLKAHLIMTLTVFSSVMLDQSRRINPECEHVLGDMRSLRLEKQFDAVFVHYAVCHLTN